MKELSSIVQQAFELEFGMKKPQNQVDEALWKHLHQMVGNKVSGTGKKVLHPEQNEDQVLSKLQQEIYHKRRYMDYAFGYLEVASLVARVDKAVINLQEQTQKALLGPLSWDLLPHPAVVAVTRAVLLLFGVQSSIIVSCTDSDLEEVWRSCWGVWIMKNIQAHTEGWQWVASNQPAGLFTKPYALSAEHLDKVEAIIRSAMSVPESHRCWQSMPAYACLRHWVTACLDYVHMKHHCLRGFPPYDDVQVLTKPPAVQRSDSIWFRLESSQGIPYFYNRADQRIVLEKPSDFDGNQDTDIPLVVEQTITEILANDPSLRMEIERRGYEKYRALVIEQDEWIEFIDQYTREKMYYSIHNYCVSAHPPSHGIFISYTESIAYKAVIRLQTVYRKRQLQKKLRTRQVKRTSLPSFSTAGRNKKFT